MWIKRSLSSLENWASRDTRKHLDEWIFFGKGDTWDIDALNERMRMLVVTASCLLILHQRSYTYTSFHMMVFPSLFIAGT